MRDSLTVDNPRDWGSPVSGHLIDEWADVIAKGIKAESLYFQRSCTSKNPAKLPQIVGCWDRSSQAFSATVYVTWVYFKDPNRSVENLTHRNPNDNNFDEIIHEFHSILMSTKS